MNTNQLAADCHVYLPTCGGFFLDDILPNKDKLYYTWNEFFFNGILIKSVIGTNHSLIKDRLTYYYGVNGRGAVSYSVKSRETGEEVVQTFKHIEPLFILPGARNLHQAITIYSAELARLVQGACAAFIAERNRVGGAMTQVQKEIAQKAKASEAGFGVTKGGVLLATSRTCTMTPNGKHKWGMTPNGVVCQACGQKKT